MAWWDDGPAFVDQLHALLLRCGSRDWDIENGEFWCHVTPRGYPMRRQGWKLHVSATSLSAPMVLRRAGSVLIQQGCAFKFAGSPERVMDLLDTRHPRGGAGKFITAYPKDDDHLTLLAGLLAESTYGLPGPDILSDRRYRPNAPVFYRFGTFTGVPTLTDDGVYEAMITDPDGTAVRDERRAWFSPPSWVSQSPLEGPIRRPTASGAGRSVLLDGRFRVTEAIQHANKGGVFRALDTTTGENVVIKQARRHVGSVLSGLDVRDSLRNEARLLDVLSVAGRCPAKIAMFEQQGDLFLVQEELPGQPLSEWVYQRMCDRGGVPAELDEVVRFAREVTDVVERVQQAGIVLCDLTPNNLMVDDHGGVRLIDLEFAGQPGEWSLRGMTPGFTAPEVRGLGPHGVTPDFSADLYSLGAVILYLVSGASMAPQDDSPDGPRASPEERVEALLALLAETRAVVDRMAPLITGLMQTDVARRWDCARVRKFLDGVNLASDQGAARSLGSWLPPYPAAARADRLLTDGLAHVVDTMADGSGVRLWPSGFFGRQTDPCNVQHGAAGVLATLVRAHRWREAPDLSRAIRTVADWIVDALPRAPRTLPGLYFGRSGTAWALYDAGDCLGEERLVRAGIDLGAVVPLDQLFPDVCHGVAGAGLAQLHLWRTTGDARFAERASVCAERLAASAQREPEGISWTIPEGLNSELAGTRSYGFAHGVAGIGAFLLAAGQILDQPQYLALAVEAGETLLDAADVRGDAAFWTTGPDPAPARPAAAMADWCNGSAGVGAFLVRLAAATGDPRYQRMAERAAFAGYAVRASASSVQCHGLAGRAELLLDLADRSDDPAHRRRAEELVAHITVAGTYRGNRLVTTDESMTDVLVDHGTGLSGVLALLLRMRDRGGRMWMVEVDR